VQSGGFDRARVQSGSQRGARYFLELKRKRSVSRETKSSAADARAFREKRAEWRSACGGWWSANQSDRGCVTMPHNATNAGASATPPLAPVPPPAGQPPAAGQHELTDDVLVEIKQLADRVGGLDKLRDLVDTLAEVGH
jgi:hypothetical protein